MDRRVAYAVLAAAALAGIGLGRVLSRLFWEAMP